MAILDWIYPKKCVGCGVGGTYVCVRCKSGVRVKGSTLRYYGVVRKLIKEIKYRGSWDMVKTLIELWENKCGKKRMDEGVVTAVPMWEQKRRRRGFNQAELIARELVNRWGLEYQELLIRARETKPMYGLSRSQRRENVRGAFQINPKLEIRKSKIIILVDDVRTSGATMDECARILALDGWGEIKQIAMAS